MTLYLRMIERSAPLLPGYSRNDPTWHTALVAAIWANKGTQTHFVTLDSLLMVDATHGTQVAEDGVDGVQGCTKWQQVPITPGMTLGPVPLCFGAQGPVDAPLKVIWDPERGTGPSFTLQF